MPVTKTKRPQPWSDRRKEPVEFVFDVHMAQQATAMPVIQLRAGIHQKELHGYTTGHVSGRSTRVARAVSATVARITGGAVDIIG